MYKSKFGLQLKSTKVMLYILYLLALVILVYLALYKSLQFDFYRDDWTQFWYAKYYPELFLTKSTVFLTHPGAAIEEFVGLKLIGTNYYYWQIWGLALRLLDTLSLVILTKVLTKSTRASLITGLFYAPLTVGLESIIGVSSHTPALIIFFYALGFAAWIKAADKLFSIWRFAALPLIAVSVWISPIKALPLLVMIPIWELLESYRQGVSKSWKKILYLLLLLPMFFHIYTYTQRFGSPLQAGNSGSILTLAHKREFLNSLGNAILGWVYPIKEEISNSPMSNLSLVTGVTLLAVTVFLGLLFIKNKTRFIQISLFSLSLVVLCYFPNWLSARYMSLGASHRYFTLSGLGIALFIGNILYRLPQKLSNLLLLVFISASIYTSNLILSGQSYYRDHNRIESVILSISNDVPQNQKDVIFMYQGGQARAEILDFNGAAIYAFKRNITRESDLPISTNDLELIKKLICQGKVSRPALNYWQYQQDKIPLSHIYEWRLTDDGTVTNLSSTRREDLRKTLTCNFVD